MTEPVATIALRCIRREITGSAEREIMTVEFDWGPGRENVMEIEYKAHEAPEFEVGTWYDVAFTVRQP